MFFQRYVHVVLDAVLGAYVKNIDPDALRISVWNGKIEVDALELQPDAFPLPAPLRLAKGTLHRLRIDLPWANLANEPIRVDIEAISLLLRVADGDGRGPSGEGAELEAARLVKRRLQSLQRKRATLDAFEKASEFSERSSKTQQPTRQPTTQQQAGWTQSLLAKLLVKALDNLQVQVQHLHVRMEDAVSSADRPCAVGVTLESLIIKSADEGWNYTMVVRSAAKAQAGDADAVAAAFLRKKMDINKLGVYWTTALERVPQAALDDNREFAAVMQRSFAVAAAPAPPSSSSSSSSAASAPAVVPSPPPSSTPLLLPPMATSTPPSDPTSATTMTPPVSQSSDRQEEPAMATLFRQEDYLIHPLTVSMKLTINDGNAKLPLTHQELSQRVLSRLGTPWLVDAIDAIGDDAWREFVASMPRLAGGRKYTLGFVFSEAWSVARDLVDEEDAIPSVEQFKAALASCLQWAPRHVERLSPCVARYREAVVHIMDEKSTYIDAAATVDDIHVSLRRQQYLSALSLISFVTVQKRQARYLKLRPVRVTVHADPRAWWRYAIGAVLLDVRERLARVDWEQIYRTRAQQQRYRELYALSTLAPLATAASTAAIGSTLLAQLVSPQVRALSKDVVKAELDELEIAIDVQDLMKLRHAVKQEIARLKEKDASDKKKQVSTAGPNGSDAGAGGEAVPASSRLWAYASWLVPGVGGATATAAGTPSLEPPYEQLASSQQASGETPATPGATGDELESARSSSDAGGAGGSATTPMPSPRPDIVDEIPTVMRAEDVKWSDQDAKDLYDAIDFHPDTGEDANDDTDGDGEYDDDDDSVSRSSIPDDSGDEATTTPLASMTPRRRRNQLRKRQAEQQHIWYRFQLHLSKVGFALSLEDVPLARATAASRSMSQSIASQRVSSGSAYLIASLDDAQIQFLVRPSSVELGLQLRDAFFCQHDTQSLDGAPGQPPRSRQPRQRQQWERQQMWRRRANAKDTDFFLERMAMEEILRYHPEDSRRQMSSVRLHDCERELPLISLSVESERPQPRDAVGAEGERDGAPGSTSTGVGQRSQQRQRSTSSASSSGSAAPSSVLRVSLVTQAIKCNANLLFLLDVVAVFSRPINVDLSGLEQSAWKRAQSLQRYSAAQLNDALARRTMIELRLDVISPLINVIQSPIVPSPRSSVGAAGDDGGGKEVSLLVFLGHLQAATKQPLAALGGHELSKQGAPVKPGGDACLYDVLEFSITGIEVQILDGDGDGDSHPFFSAVKASAPASVLPSPLPSPAASSSWRYLLEKTSLRFSFHTSVTPADPGIPLIKLFGGVASVHLNLSASSFRALMRLLGSFGADFSAHAQRRVAMDASRGVATTLMRDVGSGGAVTGLPTASTTPQRQQKAETAARRDSGVFGSGGSSARSLSLRKRLDFDDEDDDDLESEGGKKLAPAPAASGQKDADDHDLLKLWKRVICQLEFVVGDVTVKLQLGEATDLPGKIVRARAADIRTHLTVRSFDRHLEFALGTFSLEELLFATPNPTPADVDGGRHATIRYLMKSGSGIPSSDDDGSGEDERPSRAREAAGASDAPRPTQQQLIAIAITSIASDAVLPKDQQLWSVIGHADSSRSNEFAIWQDPLLTPLSVDVNLQVLTINVYQQTFAEILVFFFRRDEEEDEVEAEEEEDATMETDAEGAKDQGGGPPQARYKQPRHIRAGTTLQDLVAVEESKLAGELDARALLMAEPNASDAALPADDAADAWGSPSSSRAHDESTFSRKLGAWMTTSFLDNMSMPDKADLAASDKGEGAPALDDDDEPDRVLPASLQLRIHVDGLSLYLHLDDKKEDADAAEHSPSASSLFAVLTAQRFCCCMQRFPRFFSIYAYLSSLKICDASFADKHLREIISHGDSPGGFKTAATDGAGVANGHVPTLEEILDTIDRVPAVFSCAAQFYGADNIQQAWHPGYSSRYSVRLKAPRIRFLYSFVDDMRNYLFRGELLETVTAVWARERAEMVWEGDYQLAGKTSSQSTRNRSDGGASSSGGGHHLHSSGAASSNGSAAGASPLRGSSRRGYKHSQSSFRGAASGNSNQSSSSGSHFLGSDVVSMFPLVDLQLEDAVLEMPPHRMSSEALVLRFDRFRLSNEHVRASVEGMDNKIVAKVLLNSSLTQLQVRMSTLRIVSVILVDRGVVPPAASAGANAPRGDAVGGGGFITQSLLGSTNLTLSVDFRSRTTYQLAMDFSPVRLVCNQEQYAFVLRVPMQNYRERSRYPFLRREVPGTSPTEAGGSTAAGATASEATGDAVASSPGRLSLRQAARSLSLGGAPSLESHTARSDSGEERERSANLKRSATIPVTRESLGQPSPSDHGTGGREEQPHEAEGDEDEVEERYVVLEADIPEITMEILQGQEGYHPSDSGDLDMADKGRGSNRGSICVLELSSYAGRADYSLTTGRFGLDMALGGIHIRDSRVSANLADAYRDVVVFEQQPQRQQSTGDRVSLGTKALALQFSRETMTVDPVRVEFEHAAAFRSARRASSAPPQEDKLPQTPRAYRASPSFSGGRLFANPRFRSASSRTLVGMFGRNPQYYEQLSRGISESSMSFSRRSSRPETSTSSQRGSTESGDEGESCSVGSEVRMELMVEVAGFRVISSNIYYDVLRFLGRKSSASDAYSVSETSDSASDRSDRVMRPRSRSHSDGDELEEEQDSDGDEEDEAAVGPGEAPVFRRISVDVTLGPSVVLMVEDPQKAKSRAVMLSWEATVGVDYLCQMNEDESGSAPPVATPPDDAHSDAGASSPKSASSYSTAAGATGGSKNQLQIYVAVENVHATSRLSEDSVWATDSPERRGRAKLPPIAPRLPVHRQPTSADCLKPISLELVLQVDLSTRFLRFRSTFDRVMELRFGYLDFCTVLSALEHTLRHPVEPSASSSSLALDANGSPLPMSLQRRRTSSGSSMSSLGSSNSLTGDSGSGRGRRRSSSTDRSGSMAWSRKDEQPGTLASDSARPAAAVPQKIAARYGVSLVYLVSATFRGRIETRPVVGFYKTTWRKRYLVLPYSAHERTQVESVAFRILPAKGSRRKLGDPVYYGDRIILEAVANPNKTEKGEGDWSAAASGEQSAAATSDADDRSTLLSDSTGDEPDASRRSRLLASSATGSGSVVCKYDQLGAIGYLGPDGTAGAFETTIWKHGSSMFNSDRSVIYDREVITLEELTIYRSFGSGKQRFGGGQASVDFTSARLDQQIEGTHAVGVTTGARGGGYLMFNGVGDAPIPLALSIVPPAPSSSRRRHRLHRKARREDESALAIQVVGPSAADGDDVAVAAEATRKRARKRRAPRHRRHDRLRGFLTDLKVIEFTLPGVNATVINDFHNMLLPLLHFRVANLHADIRGRVDDKLTALTSLRVGVQAYNSQLAVWEPVVEDFDVNAAFHARGGVLCDFCMSERHAVSPTGAALRCDGIPHCLFRDSRTEVFTSAAAHAWEAKNFMSRELLDKGDDDASARNANTCVVVVDGDLNVNVSRNVINVLLHFFALVTKANASRSSSAEQREGDAEEATARLGPFIYVDNQSGIPFLVATHHTTSAQSPAGPAHGSVSPSPSRRDTAGSGSVEIPSEVPSVTDSNEEITQSETYQAFHSHAWSRRRLSTMLHDISSPTTRWMRVESGQRLPTDIIAHEAPAGSVTSPLRRLLWLKPQSISRIQAASKPIPVPIGYSNRSYLHLESSSRSKVESWHGESVICETVAEQGTLVLRLRGKIQLTNYFSLPIQVVYNGDRVEEIPPGARAAHYVPIQFLEQGTIAFRPVLPNGKLQRSDPLRIASLLRSRRRRHGLYGGAAASPQTQPSRSYLHYHRHQRNKSKQQPGALELRKALTFYWDELPTATPSPLGAAEDPAADAYPPPFRASLPPFQVILTAARKSERHETLITLRPPIQLENLVPYELSYRTVCMKTEDEVVWVEKNSASFSGSTGRVSSGVTACIAELEILAGGEDAGDEDVDGDDALVQTPTIVGLSLAIPEIGLRRFSPWSKQAIIYGAASPAAASFCERIELSMPESAGVGASARAPGNKLTICVEVMLLDQLQSPALNALAPVVCRVFTEYWLIDRTSLSLAFYTADGYRIPSNDPAAGRAAPLSEPSGQSSGQPNASQSAISLSVYSSESTQHVSKMKIGIKMPAGREVQSDPFDISAVGVRGQILVPTSRSRESRSLLSTIAELGSDESAADRLARKQFEFGVMVEQGPARFARSRVVTLVPRFYLVNSSSRFDMHLRQERAGGRDVLVLGPRESKVFHWTDYRLPPRVQVRFVLRGGSGHAPHSTDSSQWSAPFELSSVGNFVLRVKANPRPAPGFLPRCFQGGRGSGGDLAGAAAGDRGGQSGAEDPEDDEDEDEDEDNELFFDDEAAEDADGERQWRRVLARDVQLNVVVELHDPSFFIYLEEGSDMAPAASALAAAPVDVGEGGKAVAALANKETGFVPYRVKNECNNLELVVWQKTFTKDDRGNVTVGYEGGETVLPFHTLDYVPYRFAASPTVVIQLQQVVGLIDSHASAKSKRGRSEGGSRGRSSRFDASAKATSAGAATTTKAAELVDSASRTRRVVAAFEVQLKKLQRLPTIDISDGKLKKRLWAEVLLDETSKTLFITDMLPGVSGEHKRRRRATLLRSWKTFNKSISTLSHALAVYSQPRPRIGGDHAPTNTQVEGEGEGEEEEDAETNAQKKKRVRFALDGEEDDTKSDKSEAAALAPAPPERRSPVVISGLAVSVRLVEATGLEHVVAREGGRSSDWASTQLFLVFRLRAGDGEVRAKITPQANVVFPRWVPAATADTVLSAFVRASSPDPSAAELDKDAEVVVEIREPDRLLFSSSVVATVRVPLQDYVTAAIQTLGSPEGPREPHVVEFLAPAVPTAAKTATAGIEDEAEAGTPGGDSPLTMIRFELASQFVRTVVSEEDSNASASKPKKSGKAAAAAGDGSAERAAEPVVAATEALRYYALQKGLDALVRSKAQLKLLLEREAVDTSTGASAGHAYRSKDSSPPSTPEAESPRVSSAPKRSSGLSRLAIQDLEASSSQGSDGSGGSRKRGSVASMTTDESVSDGANDELGDDKRLTAVVVGVSGLEIPAALLARNAGHASSRRYEPKVYCTVTYQESTRSALSVVAKRSAPQASPSAGASPPPDGAASPLASPVSPREGAGAMESVHLERVRTHEFPRGRRPLGLDLVYQNGRVIVQGVLCDSPCGALLFAGQIRVGDTVVAVNHRSIVNLRRESSFAAIQRAMSGEEDGADGRADDASAAAGTFSLSFLYQPDVASQRHFLRSSSSSVRASGDRARRSSSASRHGGDGQLDVEMFDAEWNRRVEFMEEKLFTKKEPVAAGEPVEEAKVLVRVYLRNETSDHGLSASQESSIVPFLYFFGDDAMMDHLDHSKQDSRFDVLLAECWVPLPPSTMPGAAPGELGAADGAGGDTAAASAFHERICALYEPLARSAARSTPSPSSFNMIGRLRLALKWDWINPLAASRRQEDIKLYCQLEVARISVSIVDDASTASAAAPGAAAASAAAASATASAAGTASSGISAHHQPREVLCISLSNQRASAGIQLSYGLLTDGRHVLNARVGHFQVDNQLLDTNYPVLLRPMRLVDAQLQVEGGGGPSGRTGDGDGDGAGDAAMLLPTLQLMAVLSQQQPNVMQFEYIFGQLQELEIKLEDATLVALAQVFYGIDWSATSASTPSSASSSASVVDSSSDGVAPANGRDFGSSLALRLLEKEWATPTRLLDGTGGSGAARRGGAKKVLLRWLLLCPIKVNVTFTSTADRSLLLSLLSPDMSSALSTVIGAAAALVSNLDQAPIRVPEFYVENLLETTHTLAFYAMQHYVHHGLRSWYNIVGSVDFLGNPVGLVSTLGTGVKDFFYTPAQMLLEDEKGLRIENLRTGMTMGSKSLLRNTAVGIFHATGKITETLGKGIALLAMDEQYNAQRQRQSTRRQTNKVGDLGGAIAEGGRGLVGGVWDGVKGLVAAPVRGAEEAGAGGFVVGIGKGFAGLVVKPTAGFLDLLTSLSRGAKSSAEQLDGAGERDAFDGATRFRLPRRICADGVVVSYSEREARGYAVLLLTSLDETDDYVFHVDYGMRPHRGLVMLTDKRIICLNASTGQKLWEVALDSRLDVAADGAALRIGQSSAAGGSAPSTLGASAGPSASARTYSIECDDAVAANNFRVAVDSARVDLSATRYLLLNLEKNQEEARTGRRSRRWRRGADAPGDGGDGGDDDERAELNVFMENVQDTTVTGVSAEDLASQPLRSVRVELCHLLNKDAHANVPQRPIDRLLPFSVYQVQVYGGPYQWSVYRRFSEFRGLCARLEALGAPLDALPPLPPRTIMPSTRDGVARHRQEALNIFLQAASMHSAVSRSAPMLDFLTREAQEVRVSLPPLSPTGGGGGGGHGRLSAAQRPDASL